MQSSDLIENLSIPEELLPNISGNLGKWQIIVIISMFSLYFSQGLSQSSSEVMAIYHLKYSCQNVTFVTCKSHCTKIQIFSKIFFHICNRKRLEESVDLSQKFGLIFGSCPVGYLMDKYGRKLAGSIFIFLYIASGLVQMSKHLLVALVSRFLHGFFLSSLLIIPLVSVTEVVGNKWRSFCLGLISLSSGLSFAVSGIIQDFVMSCMVLVLVSLPFAIILSFFQNSPNWVYVKEKPEKATKVVMEIIEFNKINAVPSLILRRFDNKKQENKSYYFTRIFRCSKTRLPFLSLGLIWFFHGIFMNVSLNGIYECNPGRELFSRKLTYGTLYVFGVFISVSLCHFIKHRISIWSFATMGNFLTFNNLILGPHCFMFEKYIIVLFYSPSLVTLENLSPRHFPTDLRSQSVGLCLSLFNFGFVLAHFIYPFLINIGGALFFLFLPILMWILCDKLYHIHNRELPDLFVDLIRFKRFVKPLRYNYIQPYTAISDEMEVENINFNDYHTDYW